MAKELPPLLDKTARDQHGVITRQQALRAGLTTETIRSRRESGSWRQLYRGVYLVTSGPPDRDARLWAAVLYCGRGAVLSHATAAELHGLEVTQPLPIHVSIPSRRRITAPPGLRVHLTSRPLDPPQGHRDPPHTPICDTLLDLADATTDLDELCGWLTSAFREGKVNELQLRWALAQRGPVRWRKQLAEIAACAAAGDHSVLEYRYTRDVERAHGLPESVRQVPFLQDSYREGRRDRVYEDHGVAIELDGIAWHPPGKSSADKKRDRAAAAQGLVSLRYEWTDVTAHPCETALEVAEVLRTRGWTGAPHPCSAGCPVPRST